MGLISFILQLNAASIAIGGGGGGSILITTDSSQHTIDTSTLYTIDTSSTTA